MVHVLKDVLVKVHRSLRPHGCVLVVQPAPVDPIMELEIGGKVEYRGELKKPNFGRYLGATAVAIRNVVDEHLFVIEAEATTPERLFYHAEEYDSIEAWVEDRRPLCEDVEAFDAIGARMRAVAKGRVHRVVHYSREYKVLLLKSGPSQPQPQPQP